MKTFKRIVSISISGSLALSFVLALCISQALTHASAAPAFAIQGKGGGGGGGNSGGRDGRGGGGGGGGGGTTSDRSGSECPDKGAKDGSGGHNGGTQGGNHGPDHTCDSKHT